MPPPYPTRLGKTTNTKKIDDSPLVFTVIEEELIPASSNPEKLFCLHKLRHSDGREEYRIGYYMIAHKPRMKGKWSWGQYAPIMTAQEMAEIWNRVFAKGWIQHGAQRCPVSRRGMRTI
jgi:hypothetical protein